MKITHKAVAELAQKHGRVDAVNIKGETKMVGDGADSIELVEKTATMFRFGGAWYTRRDFENVLEKSPGIQIAQCHEEKNCFVAKD